VQVLTTDRGAPAERILQQTALDSTAIQTGAAAPVLRQDCGSPTLFA
jgi:hypothetical protein